MFSGEGRRLDLPVRARIVRYLSAIDIARKAAVLSFSHPVYDGRFTELAVLAKGRELVSDVLDGVQVGLYVLPVDVRVGETDTVGQGDRRRLSIREQFLFPVLPAINGANPRPGIPAE